MKDYLIVLYEAAAISAIGPNMSTLTANAALSMCMGEDRCHYMHGKRTFILNTRTKFELNGI